MMLALIFLTLSLCLELLAPWMPVRRIYLRALLAGTAIGLLVVTSYGLFKDGFSTLAVVLTVISMYRVLNLVRIIGGRMHPAYLRRVALRTSLWLGTAQLAAAVGIGLWQRIGFGLQTGLLLFSMVQFGAAALVYATVRGHQRRSRLPDGKLGFDSRELPTLTVAIAARNETDSLAACLDSIIASDYPKLEILVLDDNSQTRRTPEIIRSYAHSGVRFIPGGKPDDTWLARNQAMDTLAAAASGRYIAFCSTSVRLQPDSLRRLTVYALRHKKTMLSVLPVLLAPLRGLPLIEPLRAAWELLLPRRMFGRPAVRNTCWLIESAELRRSGGFSAARRMIAPEAYFARRLLMRDGYSFLASAGRFGVSSDKDPQTQRDGAVRSFYPSLHRRPEVTLAASVAAVLFGIAPLITFATLPWHSGLVAAGIAILAFAVSLAAFTICTQLVYGRSLSYRLPLAYVAGIATWIYLHHVSLYKYEFSTVEWKDRNITIPVMHVVPHLPQIGYEDRKA